MEKLETLTKNNISKIQSLIPVAKIWENYGKVRLYTHEGFLDLSEERNHKADRPSAHDYNAKLEEWIMAGCPDVHQFINWNK